MRRNSIPTGNRPVRFQSHTPHITSPRTSTHIRQLLHRTFNDNDSSSVEPHALLPSPRLVWFSCVVLSFSPYSDLRIFFFSPGPYPRPGLVSSQNPSRKLSMFSAMERRSRNGAAETESGRGRSVTLLLIADREFIHFQPRAQVRLRQSC